MKCKNCVRFVHVNEDNERTVGKPNWCFYISDSPCPDLERDCKAFTPLRNADRIRSMTDEELAEWFSIYCCRNKTYDAHCETFGSCKACWSSWLQEEAKE